MELFFYITWPTLWYLYFVQCPWHLYNFYKKINFIRTWTEITIFLRVSPGSRCFSGERHKMRTWKFVGMWLINFCERVLRFYRKDQKNCFENMWGGFLLQSPATSIIGLSTQHLAPGLCKYVMFDFLLPRNINNDSLWYTQCTYIHRNLHF